MSSWVYLFSSCDPLGSTVLLHWLVLMMEDVGRCHGRLTTHGPRDNRPAACRLWAKAARERTVGSARERRETFNNGDWRTVVFLFDIIPVFAVNIMLIHVYMA